MIKIPLSIIVPAYNCTAWIGECLDSVLRQLPENCELIVVDDGSNDGTQNLLATFEGRHPNLKIIYNQHRGPSGARNTGIEAAGGEYLSFLDCDDCLREDFDHFLTERKDVKVELTPSEKRTYMSISKALTSDFESIFYVDMVTSCFLEFYTGKEGELEIQPGGTDFFGDAREKLVKDICKEDAERIHKSLSKNNLMQWISQEETETLSFCRQKNGELEPCILQTIKTRSSDNHHIVIGVRPE